jgi:YajG family uncharacterized lipoprotein
MGIFIRIFFAFFIASSVALPPCNLLAQEPIPVELKTPENFQSRICPTPLWKNLPVVWKGIQDKRPTPQVGEQTLRGKDPVPVISRIPLDMVFEKALKDLFTQCGMQLLPQDGEKTWKLSASLGQFYLGMNKKTVTSKGAAKSRLTFLAERPGRTVTADVGYEIESTNVRYQTTRKIEKTLQELFLKTLEQIPQSRQLRDLQ